MKRLGIILPAGFTMLEILIAVVVMMALASIATAGFSQYRDRTAILVDESNQAVIQAAVKLYAYDNNALPGPLSDLTRDQFDRAYAMVSDGKRPYTLFAYLQNAVGLTGTAEAVPLPNRYLGENPQKILTCPSDATPPSAGGVSYGINPQAANKPLSWLLSNPNEDLIGETDDAINASNTDTLLNHLVYRHGDGTISVVTSVSGEIVSDMREGGGQRGGGGRGRGTGGRGSDVVVSVVRVVRSLGRPLLGRQNGNRSNKDDDSNKDHGNRSNRGDDE